MTEPVSAIAGIGFALAIFNVFLNTFSQLYEKGRFSRDYLPRLERFKLSLERCKGDLEKWDETWKEFADDDYKHFLGSSKDDFFRWERNVKSLVNKMHTSLEGRASTHEIASNDEAIDMETKRWRISLKKWTLETKHRIRSKLRPIDWSVWHNLVARAQEEKVAEYVRQALERGREGRKQLRLLERLFFALFHNQEYSDNLSQVKQTIDDLHVHFDDIFNKRFERGDKTPVHRSDLQKAKDEKAFLDTISQFATDLFTEQRRARETPGASPAPCHWNLELRVPDSHGDVERCQDIEIIRADFVIKCNPRRGGQRLPERVRLHYNTTEELGNKLEQFVRSANESFSAPRIQGHQHHPIEQPGDRQDNNFNPSSYLQHLGPVSRQSLPYKDLFMRGLLTDTRFEKAWDHAKVRLLKSLINWMLLFWNSNWTRDPCSCGICFMSSSTSDHDQQFVLITEFTHNLQCAGSQFSKNRLLRLGLILGEVILANPLRLAPGSHATVGGDDDNGPPLAVSDPSLPVVRKSPEPSIASVSGSPLSAESGPTIELFNIGRNGDGDWVQISQRLLLQHIADRGGWTAAKAIGVCFDPASASKETQPGFLNFFLENVLRP